MSINDPEVIYDILKNIHEFFSKEENRQDFLKYMEEESKQDCWTHLHCMEPCKHCMPKNADMGTIMWCDKYLVGQEELCEKECGKRWSYEPIIGPIDD